MLQMEKITVLCKARTHHSPVSIINKLLPARLARGRRGANLSAALAHKVAAT